MKLFNGNSQNLKEYLAIKKVNKKYSIKNILERKYVVEISKKLNKRTIVI